VSDAASKASSLMSGLKSSFSSGSGFSLPSKKDKAVVSDNSTSQPLNTVQPAQQSEPIQSQAQLQSQVTQVNQDDLITKPQISETEQLDTLNEVIDQVEKERVINAEQDPLESVAQSVPQAVNNIQDPLNPPNPTPVGSTKKESFVVGSGAILENAAQTVEQLGGVQTVEQEKTPEISPELESFLQHAQEQTDHLPQEIVVADNQEVSAVTHYPKNPVIVLPITPEEQKLGKGKSPKLSIRWLVEWSIKLMKKFSGKVIYREEE